MAGGFGSGAVELGVGYISVTASAKNFQKDLNKQISSPAQKAGQDAGRSMSSALGKTLKVGAIAAGTAAVAGAGMALKGGWDRALDIDNSRRVLTGLYDDAAKAGDMLRRIEDIGSNSSLDTSAYMGAAEGLAYIGVEGDRAEAILRNVGAAIVGTGGSSEQLETVNGALSNMVNLGKVNREELIQLSNAGVPVFEGLATHLGVTVEEMNKMVSEGAVSLDDVLSVMEHGTGDYFGLVLDSAAEVEQGIGATWARVKDNISNAIGFGIEGSSPFDSLAPLLERVGAGIVSVINSIGEVDFSSWSAFTGSLGSAGGAFDSIKNSLVQLQPAFTTMRDALPAIGAAAVKLGSGALNVLAEVLAFLARNVDTIIKFLPAMLAGYAAWRVASTALVASQTRLMLAQTMMAPVFLASSIARLAAVRAEERLFVAQSRATGSTVANTAATGANTGATAVNTGAQNAGIFARIRATAAMVGHRIAMVAGTVATWAATAATSALGVAMAVATSPITLIVVAIAALVAGLVWFFTQTEIGQQIWDTFVNALATGWEWVKNAFAVAWAFIQPILTGLWDTIKTIGAIIFTVLAVPFMLAWNAISAAVQFAWHNIIKPAWDAMQIALGALGTFFTWVWTAVIKPAWDALGLGIQFVWNVIVMPVWNAMQFALQALGTFFQWIWHGIIKPVWDALGAGIAWVWNMIIRPAWDALKAALGAVGNFFSWVWNSVINPVWTALGNGIRWVLDTIVHPAFEGLKTGLRFVETAFQTAVDFIGKMWDRIKGIAAVPVKFVIDEVYNNGIRAVWNKVAGWLGLDELDHMPMPEMLQGYASGGVLPGYTPGRDVHQFASPTGGRLALSGGEAIMRPEWTRMVGGPKAVADMNQRAKRGQPLGHAGRYAAGGVLPGWEMLTTDIQRAMAGSVAQAFPNQRITSGTRYQDVGSGYDNHMAGRAVDFGLPGGPLAGWIASEYPDSLELFWDPGPNLVGGAPTGAIGGHSDHVHWAMSHIVDPYTGDVISHEGPGGGSSGIGSLVAAAFSSIMDPIMDLIPEGPGLFGGVARGLGEKIVDSVRDFLMGKAGNSSANGDWVGTPGVEQFRGLVERLLREKGHDVGLTGSVLRRMAQESGGDPNAINNWDSNAAAGTPSKGLMQTIDPTFQAYKDPGYGDIWAPEDNIRASMNYAMARYGSLSAAYDRAGGYDAGGMLQPGATLAINETGKPEAILTNQQWQDVSKLIEELEFLTPEMKQLIDKGLVELQPVLTDEQWKQFGQYVEDVAFNEDVGQVIMLETTDQFHKSVNDAFTSAGESLLDDAFGTVGFPGFDRWTAVGDAWGEAVKRRSDAEAEVLKSRADRAEAVSANAQGVNLGEEDGEGSIPAARVNHYHITTRDEKETVRKLKQKDRMAMMGAGV